MTEISEHSVLSSQASRIQQTQQPPLNTHFYNLHFHNSSPPKSIKMVKPLVFITALATLAAAAPSEMLFPRACPNLASIAATAGCQVSNASDCEICCPIDGKKPGSSCHAGHDVPDPCAPNGKQYHCDGH